MKQMIALCLIAALVLAAECRIPCGQENQMCEGIAGIACCSGQGLRCYAKEKSHADWSGTCIKGCQREAEMCGGFAANVFQCCAGSECRIPEDRKNVADASGVCVSV